MGPQRWESEYVNPYIPTQTTEEDYKWPSAKTRLTTHVICGLMSDLVNCKHRKEYGHTWLQFSLLRSGVISNTNSAVSSLECQCHDMFCSIMIQRSWVQSGQVKLRVYSMAVYVIQIWTKIMSYVGVCPKDKGLLICFGILLRSGETITIACSITPLPQWITESISRRKTVSDDLQSRSRCYT